MKYLYIIFAVLVVIQVVKRRFDFLSFGALTFIAYTSNCAFGRTYITGGSTGYYYQSGIATETYLLVILQLVIINLFLLAERKKVTFVLHSTKLHLKEDHRKPHETKQYWKFVLIFCYTVFIVDIVFNIGLENFFSYTHKSELQSQFSDVFSLAIWGSILCTLYAVRYNHKGFLIASLILIGFTVILGGRAYLLTVFIGWVAIRNGEKNYSLRKNIKTFIICGVMVIAFLLYKQVYQAMRALDFATVKTILRSGISIRSLLETNPEFRTILSNYDYLVSYNVKLPFMDTVARVISIIPFANDLIPQEYPIRMSLFLQRQLHATYGLGGSFWGESVAMGGVVALVIVTLIWLVFLKKANVLIRKRTVGSMFILAIASYIGPYIHRLDWVQVMGAIKSIAVFYFLRYAWVQLLTPKQVRSVSK